MATAIDVIRKRVIDYYLDDYPISAILELDIEYECDPRTSETLFPSIRAEFLRLLANGIHIQNKTEPVIIQFDETHPQSRHFTTRSAYHCCIKDVVINAAVQRCNNKYSEHNIRLQYVLSSPIHYMQLE
jgi:hypothetical protein